ncbi:DUF1521 domain-containing protein [Sansalvadorimonas verongulae]|uniref:DUF1521 domain-containing protein n=1 Tax=Sansalvadorimonas verongulae TaxID=2172824 RepID=UPI0012BD566A|nr:DUF1521 domain-containing protein [Sansalvadorimonas verongulae]MTI14102.1 DUF1521 domain-containing protein [Sansalvadorimonas verongulae]
MSGIHAGGNIGGINQQAGVQGVNVDATDKSLSIGDLNLLVTLERAEILDSQIRDQINVVDKKNKQIRALNQLQSKLLNHKNTTAAVSENTWTVNHDSSPKEIALDNGYKVQIHGEQESFSIVDANGNATKIWGDPHVSESDRGGDMQWDFQQDATFMLDDGTKITVKTKDLGRSGQLDKSVFADQLVITKGNQSVHVTDIAANNPQIGAPELNGGQLDADTNDGYIFKMGDQADDWLFEGEEITGEWKNVTAGKSELVHEEIVEANQTIQQLLTPEEHALLEELGITVYDASGSGMLTPEEITNLSNQIGSAKESLTSTSQLDMVMLQSLTNKHQQATSLASQIEKKVHDEAKSIINKI